MRSASKWISILLVVAMLLSLCSCGGGSTANDTPADETPEVVTTTTTRKVVTTTAAPQSDWKIISGQDEFGDDDGNRLVCGIFDGTFSTSSFKNEDLKVVVFIDLSEPPVVCFRLWQYGQYQVTSIEYESAYIKLKNASGTVKTYDLIFNQNNDLFTRDTSLIDTIKNNEKLSVVITGVDILDQKDTYNFTLNNYGLADLLKQIS